MPLDPWPDAFTWFGASLLAAPAVVTIIAGEALILAADEAISGPTGLGAFLGLFASLPLLVVEYHGVFRRSRRATSLIAYLAVYFAIMGSITWIASLLEMIRGKFPGPGTMSPGEFIVYSEFLAGLVTVGLGHLRWCRLLRARPGGPPCTKGGRC